MRIKCCLTYLICCWCLSISAQTAFVSGKITNEDSDPIAGVNVVVDSGTGTTSDSQGRFNLTVQADVTLELTISHVGYLTQKRVVALHPFENLLLNLRLPIDTTMLSQVEVSSTGSASRPGVTVINPEAAKLLPSPFGEFNQILGTLPGVSINNELSAAYAVRGGNFEENLVYVNDIPIYRPFLIRAGRQEGLSFVNPRLVENIEFSAGGWSAKYGDKLSSSLNINYKEPEVRAGSATIGLLGGSAHYEDASQDGRWSYLMGVRHKNSQYLLNTLETDGEYLPRFTDIQTYVRYYLDPQNRTSLGLLASYAANRYLVVPETRETRFGTFDQSFQFLVGFDGREILRYRTLQGGLQLRHEFSPRWHSQLILSALTTREREYFEVEGAYRLCDVDTNPGSANFNDCAIIRGLGLNYRWGRNQLNATIFNALNHTTFLWDDRRKIQFGLGLVRESIADRLREFEFTDSADFSVVNTPPINNTADLESTRFTGYVQYQQQWAQHWINAGVRWHYWSLNQQWLVSPRLQYNYQTSWVRPLTFTAAVGWYRQPPFYRELRDFSGSLNLNIRAQSSLHLIGGVDYDFKMWGRSFKLSTETYYKFLENLIPYDIDNVRLRYYGNNLADGYAMGLDMRVSGAFIKGTESWFSLGLLKTEEELNEIEGAVRRPTDQRVNLGIYFEDHMPNDPTVRVYLNLLFGSGLPFGPPGNLQFRNRFEAKSYQRVDVGFSKLISLRDTENHQVGVKAIWLNAEILNLLGARNTISYTWITDLQNREFAVPNNLSQRFFNLKIWLEF